MGYGEIIKRAWTITWRYRALWVLGLFAGVAGGGGGGGGSYNFNSPGSRGGGAGRGTPDLDAERFLRSLERLLPVIIVGVVALIVIGIAWWILSVAARGGLVFAVNEIEEGRPWSLGAAWNAGFARFGSIFGLALLLALPVLALVLLIMVMIAIPIVGPLMAGSDPSPWVVAPICGTVAIGLPLLIVLSIVLGLMHELALRYVMLRGDGATYAIGEAWRAFRGRFKDTSLMWLIGWGLNIAAGIVFAIPVVIITILIVIPAVASALAEQWGAFAIVVLVAAIVLTIISLAFTAVWGTYTSALWTIFFRRFTGMERVPEATQPGPMPGTASIAPPPPWPPPTTPPPPPPPPAPVAPEPAP